MRGRRASNLYKAETEREKEKNTITPEPLISQQQKKEAEGGCTRTPTLYIAGCCLKGVEEMESS